MANGTDFAASQVPGNNFPNRDHFQKIADMPDQKKNGNKKGPGNTGVDNPKKPVEILKTSKANSNTRNPLRADLSEKPAKENKAVRERKKEDD
ncbi:hypothetical protein [Chitinophaga japonensis]|nr:hypothetical protein [Chitinophaga japonensis]